jgi:hypothetical protein
VLVRAGTYAAQLTPGHSGSAGNLITFKAYPGERVTITGGTYGVRHENSYIRVEGFEITGTTGHGVRIMGGQGNQIVNNHIHDNGADGISFGGTMLIEGNVISGHWANSHADGIQYGSSGSNSIVIRYNTLFDNGQEIGLDQFSMPSGSTVSNIEIYGNLIYKVDEPVSFGSKGIHITAKYVPVANVSIYGNTIINNHYGITFSSHENYIKNVFIRNNIIYSSHAGTAKDLALSIDAGVSNVDSDYNIMFSHTTYALITRAGAAYHTLGQFRAAYPDQEQHSQQADPQFVNTGTYDFHLLGTSPAINTGDPNLATVFTLPANLTDLDGNTRPQEAAYDIGAYEYVSDGIRMPGFRAGRVKDPSPSILDYNEVFNLGGRAVKGGAAKNSGVYFIRTNTGHFIRKEMVLH